MSSSVDDLAKQTKPSPVALRIANLFRPLNRPHTDLDRAFIARILSSTARLNHLAMVMVGVPVLWIVMAPFVIAVRFPLMRPWATLDGSQEMVKMFASKATLEMMATDVVPLVHPLSSH
jgi:hypothetical protein